MHEIVTTEDLERAAVEYDKDAKNFSRMKDDGVMTEDDFSQVMRVTKGILMTIKDKLSSLGKKPH